MGFFDTALNVASGGLEWLQVLGQIQGLLASSDELSEQRQALDRLRESGIPEELFDSAMSRFREIEAGENEFQIGLADVASSLEQMMNTAPGDAVLQNLAALRGIQRPEQLSLDDLINGVSPQAFNPQPIPHVPVTSGVLPFRPPTQGAAPTSRGGESVDFHRTDRLEDILNPVNRLPVPDVGPENVRDFRLGNSGGGSGNPFDVISTEIGPPPGNSFFDQDFSQGQAAGQVTGPTAGQPTPAVRFDLNPTNSRDRTQAQQVRRTPILPIMGRFAQGTPNVPQTGAYILEKGEQVIPAGQSQPPVAGPAPAAPAQQQLPPLPAPAAPAQQQLPPLPAPVQQPAPVVGQKPHFPVAFQGIENVLDLFRDSFQPAPDPQTFGVPTSRPRDPSGFPDYDNTRPDQRDGGKPPGNVFIDKPPGVGPGADVQAPLDEGLELFLSGDNAIQEGQNILRQLIESGGPIGPDKQNILNQQIRDNADNQLREQDRLIREQFGGRGFGDSALQDSFRFEERLARDANVTAGENQTALTAAGTNFDSILNATRSLIDSGLGAGELGIDFEAQQGLLVELDRRYELDVTLAEFDVATATREERREIFDQFLTALAASDALSQQAFADAVNSLYLVLLAGDPGADEGGGNAGRPTRDDLLASAPTVRQSGDGTVQTRG